MPPPSFDSPTASHSPERAASPDAPRSQGLQSLLDRRLPQIAALYLGGVWTVVECIDWLSGRLLWSPHWQELVFIGLVGLTPAILLLAYGHGAPGRNPWRLREWVGLPLNLLLVAVALGALYGDRDLGPAHQTVQLVTPTGDTVARSVPKSEFRKHVALFYLDAPSTPPKTPSGDGPALRKAVTLALKTDLHQDLYLTLDTPVDRLAGPLRRSAAPTGVNVPLALKRELAREAGAAFFVAGTLARTAGGWALTTRLYETDTAGERAVRTVEGPALMDLVDRASRRLREDLDVPPAHLKTTPDLPVAELTTMSHTALTAFGEAMDAMALHMDLPRAAEAFDRAVAADPTFALAYARRALLELRRGNEAAAMEAIRHAQQHDYRLSERDRFLLRANQLLREGRASEAMAVVQQWTTLYPHDVVGWSARAQVHRLHADVDAAASAYRRLLSLDPSQTRYAMALGDLLAEVGRYAEARTAYRRYVEVHPDQAAGYVGMGRTHLAAGDLEAAAVSFQTAEAVDPSAVLVPLYVAKIHARRGEYAKAQARLSEASESARTSYERGEVYYARAGLAARRARFREALALRDSALALHPLGAEPRVRLKMALSDPATRLRAETPTQTAVRIEEAEAALTQDVPAVDRVVLHSGLAELYARRGTTDRAQEHLAAVDRTMAHLGLPVLERDLRLSYVRAQVAAAGGDLKGALAAYNRHLDLQPDDRAARVDRAQVLEDLGAVTAAAAAYTELLSLDPAHPEGHVGLARVRLQQNRPDDVRRHVGIALAAWADADPTAPPVRTARRLLALVQNANAASTRPSDSRYATHP